MEATLKERKMTEMVLYVAAGLVDAPAGGATSLNKVLWFAEVAHMRRKGHAIAGFEFQHLPYGPAPRELLRIRESLVSSGEARMESRPYFGYRQDRLVARREADTSVFSGEELETLDEVIAELSDMSASYLSQLSHNDPGWRLTGPGETIPLESALLVTVGQPSDLVLERASELAASRSR